MNRKIPCEIIKDLMPLYVDGLTSQVTNREIAAHLEECEECRAMYERMKLEVEGERTAAQAAESGGIDYLKKVKRRNVRNVLLGAGAVFLVMVLALGLKLFVIGSPTESYVLTYTDLNDDQVRVGGVFYDSAAVYSRYKIARTGDGTEKLVIYSCLPSFWNRSGTFNLELELPQEGTQLDICGMTVKSDGTMVSRQANELYAARNPYIGNASADGKLAGLVGVAKSLGSYKNELQTASQPYGWTFIFEDSAANSAVFDERMKAFSCMLIALTDNLSEVSWEYTVELEDGPVKRSGRITEEECSDYVGAPVKSFAGSPEDVQRLMEKVGMGE